MRYKDYYVFIQISLRFQNNNTGRWPHHYITWDRIITRLSLLFCSFSTIYSVTCLALPQLFFFTQKIVIFFKMKQLSFVPSYVKIWLREWSCGSSASFFNRMKTHWYKPKKMKLFTSHNTLCNQNFSNHWKDDNVDLIPNSRHLISFCNFFNFDASKFLPQ